MICSFSLTRIFYSALCALALLFGFERSAFAQNATAVEQIVLVQNSGWMEPFYEDRNSPFIRLVQTLIDRIGEASPVVTLASFSQSVPQFVQSPQLLKRGSAKEVNPFVANIRVQAKSADPSKLADTDFKEALTKVVSEVDKAGGNGIIWLVTNNKNSPNNDPDTLKRNREYYEFVHKTTGFKRVLAWPLKMPQPLQGKLYRAHGLMIYAFAYGVQADALLRQMASGSIASVLNNPPARLKPQNSEVVIFKPTGAGDNQNIKVRLAPDGRTVVMELDAAHHAQSATLQGHFVNAFNLYDIKNGTLSGNYGGIPLNVSPNSISDLRVGQASAPVTFSVGIPPLKSAWSLDVLMQSSATFKGELEIVIAQELSPSSTYKARFQEIFPNDPLPEIFNPIKTNDQSTTHIPLHITINYPVWSLLVLGAGALVLLGGLIGGGLYLRREKRIPVVVDGAPRNLLIKPFQTVPLRDAHGAVIAKLKRGLGKPQIIEIAQGHQVSIR